jgi:hypothetical protein
MLQQAALVFTVLHDRNALSQQHEQVLAAVSNFKVIGAINKYDHAFPDPRYWMFVVV